MTSSDGWELCKENIQPLKQGRNMSILKPAVDPDSEFQMQLTQERLKYEDAIRHYDGDDPLDGWHQYIRWIEQNFPKGGKTSRLQHTINECLLKFQDDTRYTNDLRFVNIFLKFASIAPVPLDIYHYMYSAKIGCKLAVFFKSWANYLESIGNMRDADCTIKEGLSLNAEPRNDLLLAQRHLTARAARCPVEDEIVDQVEPRRAVLGALKPFGPKHKVGVTRTGAARQNVENKQFGGQSRHPKAQEQFVPFSDEAEVNCEEFGRHGDVKAHLVVGNDQENELNPCKWTKAKVVVKRDSQPVPLQFPIHVDPAAVQPMPVSNPVVDKGLSVARKTKSEMNIFSLKPPKETTPTQRFMFCKEKLAYGSSEVQFEELRALKWKLKQAMKKQESAIPNNEREMAVAQSPDPPRPLVLPPVPLQSGCSVNTNKRPPGNEIHSSPNLCNNLRLPSRDLASRESFVPKNVDLTSSPINAQVSKVPLSNLLEIPRQSLSEKNLSVSPNVEPRSVVEPPDENRVNPQVTSSFMNVLWNATVADPISEFIKEESHLLKEPYVETECIQKEKPKFSIFRDNAVPSISIAQSKPLSEKPKFSIFRDNAAPSTSITQSKPMSEEPKFSIFCDDAVPSNSITRSKPMCDGPEINEDRENILAIRPCGDVERKLIDTVFPSADFIPEELENENLPEFRPLNTEITTTFPSTTVFLKNLRISSTPSKVPVSSTNKQDQIASTDFENKHQLPIVNAQEDHSAAWTQASNFVRRNSMLGYANNGLSPITETSREYKSSSSSGMSSTGAVLSQGRSRFFRSKTQDEISSVAERTAGIRMSRFCVGNPFDKMTISEFLQNLQVPLHQRQGFTTCKTNIPAFKDKEDVEMDDDAYRIIGTCGAGSFAKVVLAMQLAGSMCQWSQANTNNRASYKHIEEVALKVQTPACLWEFYIANELSSRISRLNSPYNVLPSIMNIHKFYHFNDGSVIATDFCHFGSLLNIVNVYLTNKTSMPECLVIYFTIEMLHILKQVHECRIIHADIKPDNILVMRVPSMNMHAERYLFSDVFGNSTTSLKLIDYGRSIDLALFPPNVTFTDRVETSGFICPAMMENKPWTFQIDFYGAAACIHVMLFGEYLKIWKSGTKWLITSKFKRYWQEDVWKFVLDSLINIPDCDSQPDVYSMISALEDCLMSKKMLRELPLAIQHLNNMLNDR